jgi:hypothetical protein
MWKYDIPAALNETLKLALNKFQMLQFSVLKFASIISLSPVLAFKSVICTKHLYHSPMHNVTENSVSFKIVLMGNKVLFSFKILYNNTQYIKRNETYLINNYKFKDGRGQDFS